MKIKDILRKRLEKQIAPQIERELGNKSLAYMSRVIRGLIPTAGVDNIRKRVIGSIENDLKYALKKNPLATIEELIQDAVNTPDYMALLGDLGMGKEHLELLAMEARQKWGKK